MADGKQTLGVFLNFIKSLAGAESAKFIEHLFRKYPLDAALLAERPLDHWRGTDSPDAIKEKIIGENTLRHIYFLERALQAARAVAHLRVHAADGLEACGTCPRSGISARPEQICSSSSRSLSALSGEWKDAT